MDKKTMYREGKDGKEYIYYKSRKNRIIIRDFFLSDATDYYNAMVAPIQSRSGKEKEDFIKSTEEIIRQRDIENDTEFSLLITTVSGKILGNVDIYIKGENTEAEIYMRISAEKEGRKVIDTLKEMQMEFYWIDNLYLSDGKNSKLISSIQI